MKTISTLVLVLAGTNVLAGEWTQLPSIPDKEGFAGSFAGVSNGALLVAGGANFPDKKPWEGGKKVWYDTVYVLERPDGEWKVAGKLPRSLGYGVSATYRGGLICVGGSDSHRHYADVFRLAWGNGTLITTKLPPLPQPIANSCGALVGDVLYVAGGLKKPDSKESMDRVWTIDLVSPMPKWKEIESCPGSGRMLAVASGHDGAFWLLGGVELVVGRDESVERRYLKDAYRYDPQMGWKRIADLPHSIAAAPSPAPADAAGIYVLGGDDGSQVGVAPDQHRGFGSAVLRYDLMTKKWVEAGEVTAPRVTAPCVRWNMSWAIPSGEVHPGVRSPEVWSWTPGTEE